ncbi:MAG TPA: type IV secretory system conjugative DNA transfer family protein [Acidimicrobiales bacterium]
MAALVAPTAAVSVVVDAWLTGKGCAWLATGRWPGLSLGGGLAFAFRLVGRPGDPSGDWRAVTGGRWGPSAGPFYALLVALPAAGAALLTGAISAVSRRRPVPRLGPPRPARRGSLARRRRWAPDRAGRWATVRDLRPLVVRRAAPGRVVLGRHGRGLVAGEAGHSVLVVGPTQTYKTSGLVVPALLEWEGPVLAASVKSDLARVTAGWRERRGRAWVFDPTATTGLPAARWSPLGEAANWAGAQRMAAWLCESGRSAMEDGDFWYATAQKLLAPLLLAASVGARTMADVVRWVDEQEVAEVAGILDEAGEEDALRAAEATWRREPRQRGSVFTTAETVLAAFADPAVARATESCDIAPDAVLDGGWHSLYLCAPSHEQDRMRPVFTALVQQIVRRAYALSASGAAPLDPPLLVVIDEAAHVAPLADLDRTAATAAAHGIQLVTVWQDLAQVAARYGARAATVVNNHRARLVLSGVADAPTLEQISRLAGEAEVPASSVTTARDGGRSTTASHERRPLLAPGALRRLPPGDAVLLYGHLPPARVRLRPWFQDPALARRGQAAR